MDSSKNNLIVLGGAGLLLAILLGFGILGAKSNPGSVANQAANFDLSAIPDVSTEDNTRGATNARVRLIEYSDIECPFCQQYHDELIEVVDNQKLPNFSWTYRHFPLTTIHPDAFRYAVASECAAEQGQFWGFLDILVNQVRDNRVTDEAIAAIASGVGIDSARLDTCMEQESIAELVQAEILQAQAGGATGTPFNVFEFDSSISTSQIQSIQNLFGPDTAIVLSDDNKKMAIGGIINATQIREIVNTIIEPAEDIIEQNISEGTIE